MAGENLASTVLTSMGRGSGVDVIKLARDLTDVTKLPREERLNKAKEASEAEISAHAVLKYNVQLLIDQFNGLNDASELATPTATSSGANQVSITATDGTAKSGLSTIHVDSLATSQRNLSDTYSSKTQSINGGSAFQIDVTLDSTGATTAVAIAAGNDTPEGVVSAINAANLGITASLLTLGTDGDEFQILLEGETGAANSYTVATNISGNSDLGFHSGENTSGSTPKDYQEASNAAFTFNGVAMERASNTINDVVTGVTLSLNAVHSNNSDSETISVTSDQTTLKTKLQSLVAAYNDTQFALNELSDPDSDEDEVGGALARDLAVVRTVRDAVYEAVTQDSSTASGNVTGLRDIGVTLTRDGNLSFDETTYDEVAASSFDDISMMLSAGTNNQSRYDEQSQGLAIDAVLVLENLTDSISGVFATRTSAAEATIAQYETDLLELERRMEALYQRYLTQFTVMESLVNQLNSTRESMATTWENMGNANKR